MAAKAEPSRPRKIAEHPWTALYQTVARSKRIRTVGHQVGPSGREFGPAALAAFISLLCVATEQTLRDESASARGSRIWAPKHQLG